ncbi:uncharacterized protein TNIN_81541 [Trichonephila inaurata madagascariensis]|uniref:Gustatory receptor n=1 Tax=Trichonephila inaurata madagascariensis TaxID=2747483 RepID=A0A8X6XCU5_9ARAC|nr:uncharacterized protein TNIN_81541 [Trichonephila inaurata madagascariensis]
MLQESLNSATGVISKIYSPDVDEDEIYKLFKPLFNLFNLEGIDVILKKTRCGIYHLTFQIFSAFFFFAIVVTNVIHEIYLMTIITEPRWFKIIASHNLIQVLGTIQALMLYRKRKALRKVIEHLRSTLRLIKPIMKLKKLKIIRKCLIVAILIMLTFHFAMSQILAGKDLVFLKAKQLPLELAFNLNISWETTKLLVRFASLSRQMNFIWMDSFLLYYCLLCCVLKSAFEKFRMILLEGKERSKYLHIHNSLTEAVLVVDDAYSSQIFFCCALQLISIFLQVFLMNNVSHDGIFFYRVFSAWISLSFVVVVICASGVGESAIKVKEIICQMDFNASFENWSQLLFKLLMSDTQLTVWKIISIKRVTILNVLGAFFTYTVIIVAL